MAADSFQKERQFYLERGVGGSKVGFGKRPAILVIDLQLGFTDPTFPLGSNLDRVVESCCELIKAARPKNIPVIFTTCGYEKNLKDAGLWKRKSPSGALLQLGTKWTEIDPRLGKTDDDILIIKKYASGFFGTHLNATLNSLAVDTLIITGATTSGCARATSVDALQYGYCGIVPEECVGDRAELPHMANLFDIGQKYCDVMKLNEVLEWIQAYRP